MHGYLSVRRVILNVGSSPQETQEKFNCKCFYFQSLKIPLSLEVYLIIALLGSLKSSEYNEEEKRCRISLISATDNNFV